MFRKTYNIMISDENTDQNVKVLCGVFNYYGEVMSITAPKFEGKTVGILFKIKARPARFKRMIKVMRNQKQLEITPLVKNYYFM